MPGLLNESIIRHRVVFTGSKPEFLAKMLGIVVTRAMGNGRKFELVAKGPKCGHVAMSVGRRQNWNMTIRHGQLTVATGQRAVGQFNHSI